MLQYRIGRLAAVLAIAQLAAALAGCAGTDDDPAVATAARATAGTGASPTSDAVARYVEARRAWVRCLREGGFPDVPDPDARGQVAIDGKTNKELKTRGLPVLQRCAKHATEVPAELVEPPEPVTPERLARMRAYAACMRDNGAPYHPDPRPDGQWPDELGAQDGQTPQEQRARELAFQICDPVFDGRPPTTPDPERTSQG